MNHYTTLPIQRTQATLARTALALATAALCAAAQAQTATSTIVITGNPLGRSIVGQPSSVLAGDGLVLRRASTLGETLQGLPGVASTYFGPNSSRPVIRGLDGDRVRLLDNGGVATDASNLSFDHATGTDPLVTERLEVLRGPAALLYGGNATGGVVNSIDNRIPRVAAAGFGGRTEVRFGGAASERAGAVVLEGGAGQMAWHVDAYGRTTDDLRVPRHTPVAEGDELDPATRVRNSASSGQGGAVGASWVGSRGYLGVSLDSLRNRYGVTAEEDVTIRMQRSRGTLAGELRGISGFITQASLRASHTDYEHTEFEGPEVGTVFESQGNELRAEFRHAPWGGIEGVFGFQAETLDFSALGAEAFVPGTRTRSQAVFLVEEFKLGALALTAGARVERARVASKGDESADEPRFGDPRERRFTPKSASLAAVWPLASGWQLTGSIGHTERAPAYYELYADGLHVATAAYERGDPNLPTESSRHIEAGAAWKQGHSSLSVQLYQTRFSRYIALDATGAVVVEGEGEEAESAPEYAFSAVRARLRGIEVDGNWRLVDRAWALDFTGGLDLVRGDNLSTGEPLPRLAPLRLRAGLAWQQAGLRAAVQLRHSAEQDRVPAVDRATASHTQLDLSVSGPLPALSALAQGALWFVKLDNATNELAYSASTIETLRGLVPLPGRSLAAGVRVNF